MSEPALFLQISCLGLFFSFKLGGEPYKRADDFSGKGDWTTQPTTKWPMSN